MRILAGKYKGRTLTSPKGKGTRPTTSLVRKAVFDMARPIIHEATFLDLFAGTGGLGIEALSQGAAKALFVDSSPQAIHAIAENLDKLKIPKRSAQILKGDVLSHLKRLAKQEMAFNIIYIDPPYELGPALIPEILKLIDTSALLETEGLLFLEEGTLHSIPLTACAFTHLQLTDSRRYGMTRLHIFKQG